MTDEQYLQAPRISSPRISDNPILRLRFQEGLTQEQLGKKIGVRQQTIGGWERGVNVLQQRFHEPLKELLEAAGIAYDENLPPFVATMGETSPRGTGSIPNIKVDRQTILGSFATRIASGPPLNEVEVILLRDLMQLSSPDKPVAE